jgi:hypothetical protein
MRAAVRRWLAALTTVVVIAVLGALVAVPARPAGAQTATTPAPVASGVSGSTTVPTAGDPQSSRTVNRIVLALLALAALLLVLALWLWRFTKPVPAHLDGLDAMGSRRWRRASDEERASMLASVHERRSDLRDEDLIVPAEVPEPAAVAPADGVGAGLPAPVAEDEFPAAALTTDDLPEPVDPPMTDEELALAEDDDHPPEPHVTSSEAVT